MNRDDFQRLAEMRLSEGQALFDAGFYSGAYYLSGYVIECALKACICKQVQQYDFPPGPDLKKSHYSHTFSELVETADLKDVLRQEIARNTAFERLWRILVVWRENKRYTYNVTEKEARDMLDAIREVYSWIQQYW